MKQMLKDIRITFGEPVIIYCDNTSIVSMSKNHILQSKTKHISINIMCIERKMQRKKSNWNMLTLSNGL